MAVNLSLDDIKKMPTKAKVLVVCVAFFLIGYLYWFYFLSSALEKKTTLNDKLTELQSKVKEKEKIAMQLDKYKADVTALQESYKIALQKLPDQREIPTLLHSIASAGRDAGVEFALFQPKPSVPKVLEKEGAQPKTSDLLKPSDQRADKPAAPPAAPAAGGAPGAAPQQEPFYEEIPVAVSVNGSFQNILYFFDKVAKLPRIVNISDITIGDRREVKGKGFFVNSSCTIKTYMFIDKKEKTSEPKK